MNNTLKPIYEKNIIHEFFLDKKSVENAMQESYDLGVADVLNWLSKMDHLSDNVPYLIEEWNNKNKTND